MLGIIEWRESGLWVVTATPAVYEVFWLAEPRVGWRDEGGASGLGDAVMDGARRGGGHQGSFDPF